MSIQHKRERTTLILVLAIFALAVVNLSFFSFRLDLTSTGSYSISQASKDVVAQAKENVYLTYYVSKKLRSFEPAVEGLVDFLDKYAAETGSKVKVRVVDPQETGELADMQRLGLDGRQMQVVEESQASQIVVYNGMVLQYQDRQEVLPWIDQLETLEYALSDRVNRLVSKKTKNIGLMIGDPSKTLDNSFRILSKTLQEDGSFRQVNLNEPIPADVGVLIVAGSRAIDEATAFRIDQFVMNGGKALLAVDGLVIDMNPQIPVRKNENSPLNKLVENWGVSVGNTMVLDEYYNLVQVGERLVKYVEWPKVLPQNTSKSNPVTSRFGGLTLMWTSPLTLTAKEGIKAEALAWSSPKSWLMKDQMSTDPEQAFMSASQAEKKSYPYIYALNGTFTSAYTPDTVPAALKATTPAPLGKSPASRIVVVGSSTFLTDMMGAETNAVFASNTVDWLAQDDSLLSIKTRPLRDRNLTLLQDTSVRQSAAFFLSFVNLLVVPLVVLAWGIIRFVRRSRRENKS